MIILLSDQVLYPKMIYSFIGDSVLRTTKTNLLLDCRRVVILIFEHESKKGVENVMRERERERERGRERELKGYIKKTTFF